MKTKKSIAAGKRGYSLLEAVIYVAILSVVVVIVIESVFALYRAYGRSRVERRLNLNGDAAIERMVRELRSATSTDVGASTFGANPGVLSAGGKIFSLAAPAGPLQVSEQGGPQEAITSEVEVNSLYFYRQATSTSEIIKIELTLSAGDGSFIKTKNFYGSAVLRNRY